MNAEQQTVTAALIITLLFAAWLFSDQIKAFLAPVTEAARAYLASRFTLSYEADEVLERGPSHGPDRTDAGPDDSDQEELVISVERKEALLVICRALRADPKMTRQLARSYLNALGLPLSSDLWTEAGIKPQPAGGSVTPIAGRQTSAAFPEQSEEQQRELWEARQREGEARAAKYHADPPLGYEAPPR